MKIKKKQLKKLVQEEVKEQLSERNIGQEKFEIFNEIRRSFPKDDSGLLEEVVQAMGTKDFKEIFEFIAKQWDLPYEIRERIEELY